MSVFVSPSLFSCSNFIPVLQISEILANALNQNLVEFELKPGSGVIVYITQLTLGKTHF